ncbi:MAG: hypothetical protein M1840_001540 [Geoglossum simile]|nr:MAG: hypothetical protein M1840_001540 [Geoglossum simile]
MASEAANGTTVTPSVNVGRKSQLEGKYIQLLEKRIAQLEELVDADTDSSAETDSESKGGKSKKKKDKGDKEDEDNDGGKTRIRNVVSKWNFKTGMRSDYDIDDASISENNDGNFAYTFRRVLSSLRGGKDNFCEVDIHSKDLQNLLREVVGDDYPGQSWDGDIVNIPTPFAPLVHYWTELQEAIKASPSDNDQKKPAREDLQRLLESVKGASELNAYFKTRESNIGAGLTTYGTMWALFVPGQKIYAKPFLNCPQVFDTEVSPYMWESERRLQPKSLDVGCWCYDWNGKEMVKAYHFLPIKRFTGTKAINELACYPIKYFKGDSAFESIEALNESLIKRGSIYNKTVRGKKGALQMHEYSGDALPDTRNSNWQKNGNQTDDGQLNGSPSTRDGRQPSGELDQNERKPTKVQGKYIVDAEAFLTYGSSSLPLGQIDPYHIEESGNVLVEERGRELMDKDGNYNEDEEKYLVLLPPRFLGYSTQDKFWGQFKIDGTSKVSKARQSMFQKNLQLEDKYKRMIQALVTSHESKNNTKGDRPQIKDVVEDKGKGLVILLHGPPGVGKTVKIPIRHLTAETIAEATGKPLFIVSVAEIGLDASKAEKNLEQMFTLAGSWQAVLLVDEADVFLESRTSDGDPNRNALVSVLLRVLEYYQGIMILTTNRITSLDIAVQSRIHLAIRYEDLSSKYKQEIFKFFLDQLEPDSISDRAGIDEWIEEYGCDYKLNGRQIRNVVSAALALARSSAKENRGDEKLTVKHLKNVVSITKDFQEQLESITKSHRSANEVSRTGK